MPALWIEADRALRGSGLDLLFGWRQYSGGFWLGLSPDVARTLAWTYSQMRPGTNALAKAWIRANVPAGAGILKESNTCGVWGNPRETDSRVR